MSFDRRKFSSLESSAPESVGESRPEHLKEGIRRIIASIGTDRDFRSRESREEHPFDINSPGEGRNVDHLNVRMDIRESNSRGHKNAGERTYLISRADSRDKFSRDFTQCTCLIIAGIDKETGEEISIMTHQDPHRFLKDAKDSFIRDFSDSLQAFKARCAEGTIDAAIFGGTFLEQDPDTKSQYKDSIALLNEQVKANLGFQPIVIAGPKTRWGHDSAFYHSKNRRLYLIRDNEMHNQPANESYKPEDISKEAIKWKRQ